MEPVESRTRALKVWPMLAFGALLGLAVVLVWPGQERPRPAVVPAAAADVRPQAQAAQVLRLWDRKRAQAWASGDRKALRALYVDGASAGAADVAMLQQWRSRGVRVQTMSIQVLALEVVEHRPGLWRLKVTDRIAEAEVVAPGVEGPLIGPETRPGAARTRVVELRESEGTWLVASVKDA